MFFFINISYGLQKANKQITSCKEKICTKLFEMQLSSLMAFVIFIACIHFIMSKKYSIYSTLKRDLQVDGDSVQSRCRLYANALVSSVFSGITNLLLVKFRLL